MAMARTGNGQWYPCTTYEKANQINNHAILNQSELTVYQKIHSVSVKCPFAEVAGGCYVIPMQVVDWNQAKTDCDSMAYGSGLANFKDVTVSAVFGPFTSPFRIGLMTMTFEHLRLATTNFTDLFTHNIDQKLLA